MTALYQHQVEGVRRIVAEPYLWLADEMGAGKTLQAIVAAERLYFAGEIEAVIVVAPAQVYREVWSDPDLGQLSEYVSAPTIVREYRPRTRTWERLENAVRPLAWVVTNYEFLRRKERLGPLLEFAGPRTLLILDESLAVKSPSSLTTKAMMKLRARCGRVLLINGTEGGGDTPADIYAQSKLMSVSIIGCETWYEFRNRYAVMGGFRALQRVRQSDGSWRSQMAPTQIVDWTNLEDLWGRLRPHYLRRTKAECIDLPPKLPPVAVGVTLQAETWRVYREMRDTAIADLEGGRVTSAQAGVRVLRLAQLTSGFVGGLEDPDGPPLRWISREKIEALLALLEGQPDKVVVWCRFRAEAAAAYEAITQRYGQDRVGLLIGGQDKEARQRSVSLLDPRTAPTGRAVVIGTTRSGAFGINLAAASSVMYMSNEYSYVARSQSEDRVHRPGQVNAVSYFDLIASGPDGQRTVDHAIARALRKKRDLARLSAPEWAAELRQ